MLQQRSISLSEETSIAITNENYLPQGTVQTVAREEARKIVKRNMQHMLNKFINKERQEQDKDNKRKRKNE